MKYQAKTFVFRGKCGIGPTGEDEDTGVVVQKSPPESIVLERVKIFANEMLGQDEESSRKDSDMDSEKQDEQQVNVTVPTSDDHEELMRNFKSVANSTSSDLLQNVLRTSMCLEKADKGNIKDAASNF